MADEVKETKKAVEKPKVTKEAAPKSPAPDIQISLAATTHRDFRKEQLDELDEKNPEFVHMYSDGVKFKKEPDVYEWELEVKHQELVKTASGKVLHHGGDPVVKMKREEFDALRKQESQVSLAALMAKVKPDNPIHLRQPKAPKERFDG